METGSLWTDGGCVVPRLHCATKLPERLKGLLGRSSLDIGEGLLLRPCSSIHTLGMRFALDVVFIDRAWQVVAAVPGVAPGRLMVSGGWRAAMTLEAAAGWLPLDRLPAGRQLRFEPGTGPGTP